MGGLQDKPLNHVRSFVDGFHRTSSARCEVCGTFDHELSLLPLLAASRTRRLRGIGNAQQPAQAPSFRF